MAKRILLVLLAALMLFALTGCEDAPLEKDCDMVGMIMNVDREDDGSFKMRVTDASAMPRYGTVECVVDDNTQVWDGIYKSKAKKLFMGQVIYVKFTELPSTGSTGPYHIDWIIMTDLEY